MKRYGVAAFDERLRDYSNAGTILNRQSQELKNQLSIFQERLVSFAKDHNKELHANPDFRAKFIKMCSKIGIDPLTLFDKEKHLFHVDEYYYEVCVKVIEICRTTKDLNGGIIAFDDLYKECFKTSEAQMEDLEKCIDMLAILEGGFEVLAIRGKKFLQSVPNELTGDQTKILEICAILGYASRSLLRANLEWENIRSKSVLEGMVANGLLWVDTQANGETLYWDPAWITHGI
ncbi:HGL002Cp [Eremothecium sinecaudum]|uniref:Vacuolar-sorting protein SNF8 n=1 Tax=Eremothecium sinecaudum TaxID=45286 RepID=A0A109V0G9_9SACH|nr:HGL002Cp [Eremothecium sinecaudum]AMD22338.1 HGL002Cp [Eremothecium sinecaudum]